ncbi:T9SS type B sorting domain-containing protein [Flavobacterium sp.]
MKTKLLSLLFCAFIGFTVNAQFSKTHYIPPLSNSSAMNIGNKFIYISTPSINPINVQLKEIGGNTINALVSRDNPFVYNANSGASDQLFVAQNDLNQVLSNKGYIVEADDVVYVSVRVDTVDGNQAGALLSKGLASLGKEFRIGGFLNTLVQGYNVIHHTFITVLATENNTEVNFTNIKPNATLVNSTNGSQPFTVILNSGESYAIAVQGPNSSNRDALIGALVYSDKPIVVNCGSIGGTNGELSNIDFGFDQIVGIDRIGNEYIFLKNTGQDNVERVLIIANEDNTAVFLNGNATPSYTLNAGEYAGIIGSEFNPDGILFVRTADALAPTVPKNVFAYQSVGDNSFGGQANQEMFFVPPLSCQTPKVINNIPLIQSLGNRTFTGRITLTTKVGATLNFIINGTPYTLAGLTALGVNVQGPIAVTGNPNYECYILIGVSGNVAAFSTAELYLAAYGSDGAATFGGYYSGFTFNPEISFSRLDLSSANCIPNTVLGVSSLSPFDDFIWYFNGALLPGQTTGSLNPTVPGYYKVSATIDGCGAAKESDNIPVSLCPADNDNDSVNNNIDLDNDNDGIPNCAESYGNENVNLTNNPIGFIQVQDYINSYVSTIATTGTNPVAVPFSGSTDGNFTTEAPYGQNKTVSYSLAFNNPLSLSVEYATTAQLAVLLTSTTEVRVSCPVNKTLTVLNPNDQILIDTNFDGIYETGVTQFSSFEIRFRLNGNVPLASGTGTFSIKGNRIDTLKITNINLTDTQSSKVALHITATCVEKDSDNDGIPDQYDYDSDNDSIPDWIEAQGQNVVAISGIDTNKDGIDDLFGNGITPVDSDNDSYPNYLDIDSDNDGIFDIIESGSPDNSTNTNGISVGNFGTNGLDNALETFPDSGSINYTLADTDGDGIYNYMSIDSDGDGCNDVIEAGFLDSNNDGILGDDVPTIILDYGLVLSNSGYDVPNGNYIISAPISITDQPQSVQVCELQSATFTLNSTVVDSYQWQISIDGGTTWSNLTNNTNTTGATTNSLTVSNVIPAAPNYQYRAFLNRAGNTCGLYSTVAQLTTFALPVITTPIDLKQCDDDSDGISNFNLTQKNDFISANSANETFTYYTTLAAATAENNSFLIANPIAYTSGTATVFARVENSNECFRVAQINLIVSVTQIPASFAIPIQYECDDYIDAINDDLDGISAFDFTTIKSNLLAILPNNISISFYKSEADFLAETDANGNSLAIPDISNYRNTDAPFQQTLWLRADSSVDNSCYGFKTFEIRVVPWPKIDLVETVLICLPNTQTTINAGVIDGTPISNYTYQWFLNGAPIYGQNNYSLTVNMPGNYSVSVSTVYNCTRTRTIEVIGSQIASLQSIQISDLTETNTVLINVIGSGHYEYALDDIIGPYRDSNFFTNVPMGLHEVYIRDVNGCGVLGPLPITVLGIPHYFTPNGDGFHETWNVQGITSANAQSIIYIFDRFGKLIKQLSATSPGWDGTYNGNLMPADDYWYNIQFQDGRNARGHFTLKR